MKNSFLSFLQTIISYTITPVKYFIYFSIGFAAWHVTGFGLYNLFTSSIANSVVSSLLNIFEFFEFIVNLIPIQPYYFLPFRIMNLVPYAANFVLSNFRLVTSIPASFLSTFLSPILVGFEYYISSKINLSQLNYDNLKNFEDHKIFGHAIKTLSEYYKTKEVEQQKSDPKTNSAKKELVTEYVYNSIENYLINRIEYYKNNSLSPLIMPSLVAAGIITGSYFIGTSLLLGGTLATISYSISRNSKSLQAVGKYITENLSKTSNSLTTTINFVNFTAPFVAIYKGNLAKSIANNIPFKSIFISGIKGSTELTPKISFTFPSIAGLTGLSILANIVYAQRGEDKLRKIAKSNFEIFSSSLLLTVGFTFISYMVTGAPILANVAYCLFAVSSYTMIESAIIGAGCATLMIFSDRDGLPKLYEDVKNFLFNDKFLMFSKPFGQAILESWCSLGGVVIGSFIGSKLPMPEWLIKKTLPTALSSYISIHPNKDTNYIKPMGMALSSLIGTLIGGIFAKWVVSESEEKLPNAPIAKQGSNQPKPEQPKPESESEQSESEQSVWQDKIKKSAVPPCVIL